MPYPVMTVDDWNENPKSTVLANGPPEELLYAPEVELLGTLQQCDDRRLSCDDCTELLIALLIRQKRWGRRRSDFVGYIAAIRERTGKYHLEISDEAYRRCKNETPPT